MNDFDATGLEEKIKFYGSNPEAFIKDQLGVGRCECGCKYDPQQAEIVSAYRDLILAKENAALLQNRLVEQEDFKKKGKKYEKEIPVLTKYEKEMSEKLGINVRSPKGTGKDTCIAWLTIHFMCCYGKDIKNMATAPTFAQLNDNFFAEIVKWISHARKVNGNASWVYNWFGFQNGLVYRKASMGDDIKKNCVTIARTMRKGSNEDNATDTLSGYHSYYQMIMADEVYSIHNSVLTSLRTTMSRPINFAILFGNPTTNMGYANDAWGINAKFWVNIQMDLENSIIVSDTYKKGVYEEYKPYPNLLRVYYYGLPPLDEEDSIISFGSICACCEHTTEDIFYKEDPVVMTVDIGMGGDPSAIAVRQGMWFREIVEKKCFNTEENEDFIESYMFLYDAIIVGIDNIGVGKGVYDNLKKKYGEKIVGIPFSGSALDNRKYRNRRAELYFWLAEKINKLGFKLPNTQKLKGELNVIRIVKDKDIIQIEDKKTIRNRIGGSTNQADVCAMSMHFQDKMVKLIKESRDQDNGRYGSSCTSDSGWMGS